MEKSRIAVLFDAENIGCDIALIVLSRLRQQGVVQTACAVGDFSLLASWVPYGRDNGIELVMQPSLGKGKNSADIRLAIEAMDLVHRAGIHTVALVTHDRDFTPLALRLREAGVSVMGFAASEPSPAFRAACSHFELVQREAKAVAVPRPVVVNSVTAPKKSVVLSVQEINKLKAIASKACAGSAIHPSVLTSSINAAAPEIGARLSGNGKFLKTLIEHGIVERVGAAAELRVQRRAS